VKDPDISKNILVVTGTFDEEGGKPSYFGQEIYESFKKVFGEVVQQYNGGSLDSLQECFLTVSQYKIIFWMPYIDNATDKFLANIKVENPTAILIRARRNDFNNYTTFQVVETMFSTHSNLCLEVSKIAKSIYHFRVLDPLGNLWYSGDSVSEASNTLALVAKRLRTLTRLRSKNDLVCQSYTLNRPFLDAVQAYGWRFTTLLGTAVNKERFLGNASTRCMAGFPSIREEEAIFISRRDIDKRYINEECFVAAELRDGVVSYKGLHKPSVDAPSQIMLYQYYLEVKYIIHGHTYIKGAPFTKKYIPCGYTEEVTEVTDKFPNHLASNFAINLIGHGCLILAKDLDYFAGLGLYARDFPEDLRALSLGE
jgi:hypothetical protein